MHIDYDKIVEEWAWRVPNGRPDFKNQYHKDILRNERFSYWEKNEKR